MYLNLNAKKKWLMSFVSIAMIFVISITSFATSTIEELEEENAQLEVELNNANAETTALEAELGEINSEILAINEELEEINSMIELTEAQVSKTLDELEVSRAEEEAQYENMKVRIRFMYESGNSSFLEILLGAEDLADFVNKTEFISNVTEYDRDMLEELTLIREEIEEEEATLLGEQAALVELQVEAEAVAEELSAKAEETETDLVAMQALIDEIESQYAANEVEKAEIEASLIPEGGSSSGGSSSGGSTSNNGGDYSASASELDLFAAILDCEAISNYTAMLAVATVIMNRVESSSFPNTITGVIYQSGQFSPTWTGKLDSKLASGPSSLAYQVAQDALDGERLDSVSHCYYFLYAPSTSRDGVEIGDNLFFTSW